MALLRGSTTTTTGCVSYPSPNPMTTPTSCHTQGIPRDLASYHKVTLQKYLQPCIFYI